MANNVDPDQTAPIGADCSGSKLFVSILKSSVMLGNYLPGRVAQSVTCLATDASLTADPGVAS